MTGMTQAGNGHERSAAREPGKQVSGYVIRPATAEDSTAICELFNKVFPDTMSPEHWRWKYLRTQSRAIVAYRNGSLVAHYGGVGTDILLEGKASTAIQVTDLMVDPSVRLGVRNNSPFFLTAKTFLESYVGFEKPFTLGYGFPSERAMGLSEKLGLFTTVGVMHELTWDTGEGESAPARGVQIIDRENFASMQGRINRLWSRFRKHFRDRFICTRDADFMRWRYLDHPAKNYTVYLASGRFSGKPKHLLVMRHDGQKSMLMDMLSTSLDLEPVIKLALQFARDNGSSTLQTWCSDSFRDDFLVCGAKDRVLPIAIPANTGSPGLPAEKQEGKWWFMPGDTDYQ